MIDDDPDLESRYRAPRAFGPMPGPRNIPLSQRDVPGRPDEVTTSLAVTLEADADQLSRLLPPQTRLAGPAALTVAATRFDNLLWLAGRGYPILTVTFPIEYTGEYPGKVAGELLRGNYLAVLWEGLPDPVTTGREELGFPKLFGDLRAPGLDDVSPTGEATADAHWDGFRFLDLSVEGLRDLPADEAAAADAVTPQGTIVHRFVPEIGAPDRAVIDHLVLHPRSKDPAKRPSTTHRLRGTGRFTFHPARFEDMPVQYPVVNTLAALTLGSSGPATLTRSVAPAGSPPGANAPLFFGGTAGQLALGASR